MNNFDDAIAFAQSLAPAVPEDLREVLPTGTRHPNDRPLGPLKKRGGLSGLLMANGETVASYGDVHAPEVTFSAAKSYLSALAGIAWRDGLIGDLDEPVKSKVDDGGFDSEQNSSITWRHLLQQTSEWEGELFGVPDWIDRGRSVGGDGRVGSSAARAGPRELQPPGTFWEYNDVRVNRLSLALLRLFGRPLPEVLKSEIMDTIDASDTWSWHGYDTSWVEVGSTSVQSVSGGTHWGGGLWISTADHARFGQLYAEGGRCNGDVILPEEWVQMTAQPCDLNPRYGLLFWRNVDGSLSSVAGTGDAFAAQGAGGNSVFVWPSRQVVIVLRWCSDTLGVTDALLAALGN